MSRPKRDHYATLGVPKGAAPDSVKRAFRRAAKAHHPDKNGGRRSEAFHDMVLAYQVLGDPVRRERYDRTGDDGSGAPKGDAAFAEIARMVVEACAEVGSKEDVIERVRWNILNKVDVHLAAVKQAGKSAAGYRDAASRVKRKTGGENLLAAVFEGQARQCDAEVERIQQVIENLRALLLVLDEYEWKTDPKPKSNFTITMHGGALEDFLEQVHGGKWGQCK